MVPYDGAMRAAIREVEGGVEVVLWVVPGAKTTEITGAHGEAIRVRVAQPAERGRANRAALRLLADRLRAPVELVAGESARRKRVVVRGLSAAEVERALQV